jgi:hypothetical protein
MFADLNDTLLIAVIDGSMQTFPDTKLSLKVSSANWRRPTWLQIPTNSSDSQLKDPIIIMEPEKVHSFASLVSSVVTDLVVLFWLRSCHAKSVFKCTSPIYLGSDGR